MIEYWHLGVALVVTTVAGMVRLHRNSREVRRAYEASIAWERLPRTECEACGEAVITDEQHNPLPHGCPGPPRENPFDIYSWQLPVTPPTVDLPTFGQLFIEIEMKPWTHGVIEVRPPHHLMQAAELQAVTAINRPGPTFSRKA